MIALFPNVNFKTRFDNNKFFEYKMRNLSQTPTSHLEIRYYKTVVIRHFLQTYTVSVVTILFHLDCTRCILPILVSTSIRFENK